MAETINENNAGCPDDPDAWFAKIKDKHRMVFDVTHPKEIFRLHGQGFLKYQ